MLGAIILSWPAMSLDIARHKKASCIRAVALDLPLHVHIACCRVWGLRWLRWSRKPNRRTLTKFVNRKMEVSPIGPVELLIARSPTSLMI